MNSDLLKTCYAANATVQAICDHMAARPYNQKETTLARMLHHLERDGHDFKKSEVIQAFRRLEEADCGKYVEGRRGWQSRFVWAVNSTLVAGAAVGEEAEEALVADEEVETESEVEGEAGLIEHTYWLRPGLSITFELPADLTENEAARLAQYVGSLSFEE